jgi:hypothetical protein
MAIANELSSEVASAVLAHLDRNDQSRTEELKEILVRFYLALRSLTKDSRRARWRATNARTAQTFEARAASNH